LVPRATAEIFGSPPPGHFVAIETAEKTKPPRPVRGRVSHISNHKFPCRSENGRAPVQARPILWGGTTNDPTHSFVYFSRRPRQPRPDESSAETFYRFFKRRRFAKCQLFCAQTNFLSGKSPLKPESTSAGTPSIPLACPDQHAGRAHFEGAVGATPLRHEKPRPARNQSGFLFHRDRGSPPGVLRQPRTFSHRQPLCVEREERIRSTLKRRLASTLAVFVMVLSGAVPRFPTPCGCPRRVPRMVRENTNHPPAAFELPVRSARAGPFHTVSFLPCIGGQEFRLGSPSPTYAKSG